VRSERGAACGADSSASCCAHMQVLLGVHACKQLRCLHGSRRRSSGSKACAGTCLSLCLSADSNGTAAAGCCRRTQAAVLLGMGAAAANAARRATTRPAARPTTRGPRASHAVSHGVAWRWREHRLRCSACRPPLERARQPLLTHRACRACSITPWHRHAATRPALHITPWVGVVCLVRV
jgi:hypothetical protein